DCCNDDCGYSNLTADWYFNCTRPADSYSAGGKITLNMKIYTLNSTTEILQSICLMNGNISTQLPQPSNL
ncbi:MAG: hypothetical protein K6E13_02255, partial [Lachnospiraceae bacterium]|nr:hypothetical protein [Lachnospiraceae bacterium]